LPRGESQVNSVDVVMSYWLGGRSSISERRKRFFSSLQYPDGLWGSPSLLFDGYWRIFLQG
jgi:hypothetical protein